MPRSSPLAPGAGRLAAVLLLAFALSPPAAAAGKGGPAGRESPAGHERPAGIRSPTGQGSETPLLLRVQLDDWRRDMPRLAGLDVAGVDLPAGTVDVVGTAADAAALADAGLTVSVVRSLGAESLEQLSAAYLDPGEVATFLDGFVLLHPDLARLVTLSVTEEGRFHRAIKISDNVMVEEDEPAVLFDFEHHAREVMTPEIGIDLIDYLLSNYGTDPEVTAWVDGTEIWVIVNQNPDGANHVFTADDNWRKNRRNNGNGTFGVDLNRNYAFRWGACNGSSGSTGSSTYRGPAPESEPETQGIVALAREQRPVFNLTYHTYGELVLYPYGCNGLIPSDKTASENIGHRLARRLVKDSGAVGYTAGYSWSKLGVIDGESKSWFLGELGTLSYTVEASSSLAGGFLPDYNTWRDSTVQRARPGWQFILDRLEGPSIRGHVTDACTGASLEAVVGIDELPLTPDETPRTSEPLWGRYQRILTLGDYSLRASAAGYHEQVHPVAVRTAAVDRDVALAPLGSRAIAPGSITVDDGAGGDGDGRLDPGETAILRVAALATGEAVTSVTARLASGDPFVTVVDDQASYPDLGPAAEADPSDDGFTVQADAAAPVDHDARLALVFFAAEALCDSVHDLDLRVTARRAACPAYLEPLDADPGWTISNTDPTGWAFGAPTALASGKGPGSGATGVNVYGTDLDGFYGPFSDHRLTTPPCDLSGLSGTVLEFQRWLSSEEGFDYATVEASADGATWELLWTGTSTDRAWVPQRLDAAVVDGQAAARFRFRMQSDSFIEDGGFYLDDFAVCGEMGPALSPVALAVLDDTANTACTDADGDADAGEVVTLRLTAENRGVSDALGASATLLSGDPTLEILDLAVPLGDVPVGAQVQADFTARVDAAAACGTTVPLTADFAFNGPLRMPGPAGELTLEVDGAGCDANACAAACAPAAEVGGVQVSAAGRVSWAPSADACHAVAGIGYRVFRAASAVPLVSPPASFPADTAFVDVSLADADGSLLDAGLDDLDLPAPGVVFHYLVADVGTDGNRGPVGHYGD